MKRALLLLLMVGCVSYRAERAEDSPADAEFLTLRETPIHVVDEGPRGAPTVVLIHGFASSVGVWTPIMEQLSETHRVLALDLKGFGLSGRPEGQPTDYSPEEQAKIVLALMDAKSVHSAAIVAHSWGSSVALQVALQAPERVERIALYDAWVYSEQLPTAFYWARAGGVGEMIFGAFYDQRAEDKIALAFYDPEIIPQALVDTVERQLDREGTSGAALQAVRAMRYESVEPRYSEITAPTLLLWGREDTVTPLEFGERLANQLPEARLEVYPQCGHFPMIEAATPSTRSLLAFLSSPASSPTSSPASSTAGASRRAAEPQRSQREEEVGSESESGAASASEPELGAQKASSSSTCSGDDLLFFCFRERTGGTGESERTKERPPTSRRQRVAAPSSLGASRKSQSESRGAPW